MSGYYWDRARSRNVERDISWFFQRMPARLPTEVSKKPAKNLRKLTPTEACKKK